jgi:hypothetical protein
MLAPSSSACHCIHTLHAQTTHEGGRKTIMHLSILPRYSALDVGARAHGTKLGAGTLPDAAKEHDALAEELKLRLNLYLLLPP